MSNNTKIGVIPILLIAVSIFLILCVLYLIRYYFELVGFFITFIFFLSLALFVLFVIYQFLKYLNLLKYFNYTLIAIAVLVLFILVMYLLYTLFRFFIPVGVLSYVWNSIKQNISKLKDTIINIQQYVSSEYNRTSKWTIIALIIISVVFTLYFVFPLIIHKLNIQGGTQLIKEAINTDVVKVVASYEKLNGKMTFEYQYGISFWVFIHSFPPSTNSNYNKFTSILNYGNKPNILYNPSTNTLMITTEQKGLKELDNPVLDFDETGNRIIYRQNHVLLQKWNNIMINYSNGTLDVFINGNLVKSAIEVVPYMTLDNLVVGTDGGISGGICNLVYFKKPLNAVNISYLYNIVKDKSPPIV